VRHTFIQRRRARAETLSLDERCRGNVFLAMLQCGYAATTNVNGIETHDVSFQDPENNIHIFGHINTPEHGRLVQKSRRRIAFHRFHRKNDAQQGHLVR
jgi:hypothetical protein